MADKTGIQCAAIDRKINALYKKKHAIEDAYCKRVAPAKRGDIVRVRNKDTNRIKYFQIWDVHAEAIEYKRSMRLTVRGFVCTKAGLRRSAGFAYLRQSEIDAMEVIAGTQK